MSVLTRAALMVEFCLQGCGTENEPSWQVSTSRVEQFSFMSAYLLPLYTVSHKDMTCSLEGFKAIWVELAECNTLKLFLKPSTKESFRLSLFVSLLLRVFRKTHSNVCIYD